MPDFSTLETVIQDFFPIGHVFTFQNITYKVLICGKPTCSNGEPKTDIYLRLEDCKTQLQYEVKISIKKDNAEFLENKTSAERAEALLGKDWKSIVTASTLQLQEQFRQRPLVYKNKYKKTEAGAITLGWKFEILTVKSGELSAPIKLTYEQKLDIYSGSSLPISKKDAFVNGEQIINSGVADFLLYDIDLDTLSSPEEVFEKMISIENYIQIYDPQLYFACKALNYRTFKNKYDGDRPLAVFIEWSANKGKLTPIMRFDAPLTTKGNSVYSALYSSLKSLNISTTDDINSTNISSMDFIHI